MFGLKKALEELGEISNAEQSIFRLSNNNTWTKAGKTVEGGRIKLSKGDIDPGQTPGQLRSWCEGKVKMYISCIIKKLPCSHVHYSLMVMHHEFTHSCKFNLFSRYPCYLNL